MNSYFLLLKLNSFNIRFKKLLKLVFYLIIIYSTNKSYKLFSLNLLISAEITKPNHPHLHYIL